MDKNIDELLDAAMVRGYESLSEMTVGSPEYTAQVNNLEKLGKMRAAEEQRVFEASEAAKNRGLECEKMEHAAAMQKAENTQNMLRLAADILKTAGLLVANSMWMRWIMKFEETGTIATKAFGFIHKLKFF